MWHTVERLEPTVLLECKEGPFIPLELEGMIIPKNVWHTVDCLEPAVLFECKEGPFVPHELEGVMEVRK